MSAVLYSGGGQVDVGEIGGPSAVKRRRCGFQGAGFPSEANGDSPLRPASFLLSVDSLKLRFPEVPEGIVASVLESSEYDETEAGSVIRHMCEASHVRSQPIVASRKRALADAVMVSEPDHTNLERPLRGLSEEKKLAMDDSRCRESADSFRASVGAVGFQKQRQTHSDQKDAGSVLGNSSHSGHQSDVREGQFGGDAESLREKLRQSQANQLVLAKAVRSQFRSILDMKFTIQNQETENQFLKDQLKKQREAFQTLQLYAAAAFNGGGDPPGPGGGPCSRGWGLDFAGGSRGPDVF